MWVAGRFEVWGDAAGGEGDVKGREAAGCCGHTAPVVHGVNSEVQWVAAKQSLGKTESSHRSFHRRI